MDRHLHSSQPKAVARAKYREPEVELPSNLMFDKRVRRGATQGRPMIATTAITTNVAAATTTTKGDGLARTMNGDLLATTNAQLRDLLKPQPGSLQHILAHTHVVKPRVEVPTHLYLEEQARPAERTECDTQTDAFLEQAARPKYIQPKRGVDVRLQVDTALVFNFDRDVRPLLDILCGKTLEQALVEVNEEQQLRALIDVQDAHAERERSEARRIKLMEFDELHLLREKRAADAARRSQAELEAALRRKVAALAVARHQLHDVPAQALDFLYAAQAFRTPLEREIEDVFMPWLCERTNAALADVTTSHQLTDAEIIFSCDKFMQLQRDIQERMPYRLFIHWAAAAPPSPTATATTTSSDGGDAAPTDSAPAEGGDAAADGAATDSAAAAESAAAAVQTEPIGPIEVPFDATITDIREQVVTYLLDPFLRRPDLAELVDIALYTRHGLDALQTHRAARGLPPVEEPVQPPPAADGEPAPARVIALHQRRIKFVAASVEVEGTATLLQLSADGRLQLIEMRVDSH